MKRYPKSDDAVKKQKARTDHIKIVETEATEEVLRLTLNSMKATPNAWFCLFLGTEMSRILPHGENFL